MRAGSAEPFPTGGDHEPSFRDGGWRILLAAIPVLVLLLCLSLVRLPWFVEYPGPAQDVLTRIDVDGTTTYPAGGRLLLTTVSLGRVSIYDALWAGLIDPDAVLVPERDVVPPGRTDQQIEQLSLSQMDSSKVAAVAAALRVVTDYPRDRSTGVLVQQVFADTPAAGRLFPGDLIVAVDGRKLGGPVQLRSVIRSTGTQRTLRLAVRPVEGGRRRTVELRPAVVEGAEGPIIGIVPVANFPFRVLISSGNIGGPSAGLMWGLGVVDLLTPGDLTGGRTIAGTGEVDPGGGIHGIGGIGLKLRTAEDAGARVFLLPRDNLDEASAADPDLRLVPVATLAEAVRFLEREISLGNHHNPEQA